MDEYQQKGIEYLLWEIRRLWGAEFARSMGERARENFPREIERIERLCAEMKFEEAREMVAAGYEWAVHRAKIGVAYFPMRERYSHLRNLLNEIQEQVQ
ncbi:hypothetical protein HZB00_03380 [Candidatus Woesearchaeota archaeon]|nr:hypothetical protein [Candidatus Woesearchaeota archaeon]